MVTRKAAELSNLVEVLQHHATVRPEQILYHFLGSRENDVEALTFAALDASAAAIASRLREESTPGTSALLLYPPGLEFIKAFFGCLYAGIIAVPVYLPNARKEAWDRLDTIARDSGTRLVLTDDKHRDSVARWLNERSVAPELKLLMTCGLHRQTAAQPELVADIGADGLAFLQYTSGSTGDPKGVMVSHANLMHNQQLIQRKFEHDGNTVVVGWLPQYHDMGLIGNILQPLYLGATAALMPPAFFLQNPVRWLEAITRYRATTSGGPDFAYRLCVDRISEEQKQALDLSSWDLAFNGSEPVSSETLERFSAAFRCVGFRKQAFYPCYGLAEATLLVAGGNKQQHPTTLLIERSSIEQGRARLAADAAPGPATEFVSCGNASGNLQLKIVDPTTRNECASGEIGEIWVHGSSVTQGYWGKEQINRETFRATSVADERPYLRTGDLGFVHEDQLYITGRLKDLIIIRGRNFYPQDIEAAVQQHFPELRVGCGASFSMERGNEERLVLVQEMERSAMRRVDLCAALWESIKQLVTEQFGIRIHALALVKPGAVPKTSSGKIRRRACKDSFEKRQLEPLALFSEDPAEAANPALHPDQEPSTRGNATALEILAHVLKQPAHQLNSTRTLGAYGLDSVRAAELEYTISAQFGVQIDMSRLLNGLTVAEFIAATAQAQPVPTRQAKPVPSELHNPADSLAGYNEQAIWRVQMMYRDCSAYNISVPLKIEGTLDATTFASALDTLLEHQPVLSTRYSESASGQLSADSDKPTSSILSVVDATAWSQTEIARFVAAEAARPIDLGEGPLFRAHLLHLSGERSLVHLVAHHIAVDAWSLQILVKTLLHYYADLTSGKLVTRHPLKTYREFVSEQRRWLHSDAGATAKREYRQLLDRKFGILDLPADFPRPKQFRLLGHDLDLSIDASLFDAIKAKARELDVTLFTLLLASYQVLLYRWTTQKEFVIGSPVSERPTADFGEVIGCFIDLKLFGCDISPEQSFRDFVYRTKQTVLQALQHKRVPTQVALEHAAIRGAWPSAVFPNVRFALQQAQVIEGAEAFLFNMEDSAALRVAGFDIEPYRLETQTALADLSLTSMPHGSALRLKWNFNRELFETATIVRLATMFCQLLRSVISDDSLALRSIPLLDSTELERQLARSAALPVDYGPNRCVHELIEQQTRIRPNAIAVVCGDTSLTYETLNRRANQLARHLRAQGIAPEDRVGLYLRRSIDLVVAFIAALKAGACSVMLDPSVPAARNRYSISNSQLSLLLTNLDDLEGASPDSTQIVDVRGVPAHYSCDDLELPLTDANAAYIIYTSGSTGRPKGVIGLHAGVVNRTQWMIRHFGIGTDDRVLHTTPIGFVRAEREILFPLVAGATLVLLPTECMNKPLEILSALDAQRISFSASSPSLIRMLLDHGREHFSQLRSLKHWFIGADILRPELVRDIQHALPSLRLTYFYGSTEVSSDVACFDVPANHSTDASALPVGRQLANTSIYILDAEMQPVADGTVGELYVGGIQLARGYFNDPRLTAHKFIPDPFCKQGGGRLYVTGDLAFREADGTLFVTGRNDDQINVYGHRVELGEIEHVIRSQEGISDAIVLARKTEKDHVLIVAHVVCPDPASVSALRERLAALLPSYMIPALLIRLNQLPLTSLGKVDRSALLSIDLGDFQGPDHVGPQTRLHEEMVNILSELLELPRNLISVQRNFFELGANSALLSEFVVQLNRRGSHRPARISDIYQHHTIRELAAALEPEARSSSVDVHPSVRRAAARRQALLKQSASSRQ